MVAGDTVVMNHPEGYATVYGPGDAFVGWIPNGIRGVIYLVTPKTERAVVHFEGQLFATVEQNVLEAIELDSSVSWAQC